MVILPGAWEMVKLIWQDNTWIRAKRIYKLKNYKMAKVYYEMILKTEPNFLWIKDKLF